MSKRGRPPKPEEHAGVHKKSYYKVSPKREKKAIEVIRQDRLLAGYEKIYQLAYDTELSWSYKERLKEELKEEGLLL